MLYYFKNHLSDYVPEQIKKDLAQYKFVFNPSFVFDGLIQYWAFRCYAEASNEILSIIYIYDESSSSLTVHNLNPTFQKRYGIKASDPKLLKIGDTIYCTLNSGYSAKTNNSIFLINVSAGLLIKRCVIKSRSRVEKNWAFFEQEGTLKLLYSISPICKTYSLLSETEDELFFAPEREVMNGLPSLSIGTQPIQKDNNLYLISHKKYSFLKKRLYMGVPVKIDLNTLTLETGSVSLVHSLKSMLGARFRFNKNLISCTYVSGLQINFDNSRVKITYGVNDISWESVEVSYSDIW